MDKERFSFYIEATGGTTMIFVSTKESMHVTAGYDPMANIIIKRFSYDNKNVGPKHNFDIRRKRIPEGKIAPFLFRSNHQTLMYTIF